jgi:hypothetical protein
MKGKSVKLGVACVAAVVLSWPLQSSGQRAESMEATLIRLERAKWEGGGTVGSPDAFRAQFADDFISVEYGNDVSSGVQRKTRAEVFSGPPLQPAKFELACRARRSGRRRSVLPRHGRVVPLEGVRDVGVGAARGQVAYGLLSGIRGAIIQGGPARRLT